MWGRKKKKKEETKNKDESSPKTSKKRDRLSNAGRALVCTPHITMKREGDDAWERHKDEETGDFHLVNTRTGETRVLITKKEPPRPSVQDEVMAFRKSIQSSWVERFNEDTGSDGEMIHHHILSSAFPTHF